MNDGSVEERRLGRFTRGVAWVLGPFMLLSGIVGLVAMVVTAVERRWEELPYLAGGASGIVLGLLLIQAARTGRDTATEAIHGLLRRGGLIR